MNNKSGQRRQPICCIRSRCTVTRLTSTTNGQVSSAPSPVEALGFVCISMQLGDKSPGQANAIRYRNGLSQDPVRRLSKDKLRRREPSLAHNHPCPDVSGNKVFHARSYRRNGPFEIDISHRAEPTLGRTWTVILFHSDLVRDSG